MTKPCAIARSPYRETIRDLLVLTAAGALLAYALVGCGHGKPPVLPIDTPGVLNPDVTQATIGSTICVRGWTKSVRPPSDYTTQLKLRQLKAYGLPGPASAYQEDHLISLELGGDPDDSRNLWPEPYPRAAQVDVIENELNAKVCSGAISLAEGQRTESALKHTHG